MRRLSVFIALVAAFMMLSTTAYAKGFGGGSSSPKSSPSPRPSSPAPAPRPAAPRPAPRPSTGGARPVRPNGRPLPRRPIRHNRRPPRRVAPGVYGNHPVGVGTHPVCKKKSGVKAFVVVLVGLIALFLGGVIGLVLGRSNA